ncbi:MAG: hypothetical protein WBA93_28525 [Microcoleaceae cyanobacterium]
MKKVGGNFFREFEAVNVEVKYDIVNFRDEAVKIKDTLINAENFLFEFELKTLVVAKDLNSLKQMPIIEIDDAQYEYIRQSTIAEHTRKFNNTNGYAIAVNFWHFKYNGNSRIFPSRPYSQILWGNQGQLNYQPIFVPYLSDTPQYFFGEDGGIAISFEQAIGSGGYIYIHGSYNCEVSYDRTMENYQHNF